VVKNKHAHWQEMKSFSNFIQPEIQDVIGKDHALRGKWNKEFFRNDNPVILELGCGKGEYTVGLAARFPENNYLGIDIKGARIWRGAKTALENKIPNAAFLRTRIEFINSFFAENEIDEIWITFPDPYPKRRDTSKRLVSPYFLNSYNRFMKNKGIIHLKTDKSDLYHYAREVALQNNLEILVSTGDLYSEIPMNNILSIKTHYEKIFTERKKIIKYLSFRLNKDKIVEDVKTKTKSL
jgi:tRNA (guanine-N7-)-methyltransferase